jgi:ubiquinone/menaquinone biosynthesis C-methylase UbiE
MSGELEKRVVRERISHTDNDVLENSHKLKSFFLHTTLSKTIKRLENDFSSFLNSVEKLKILDVGCGRGELALALLEKGADYVAGIDISSNYVDDALLKARNCGYETSHYSFDVMDAHKLTFKDNFFDIVVGTGILHHLDLHIALAEVERVLKPGGIAIFKEPLEANPLLRLFRILSPNARTVDEKPLSENDLKQIDKYWIVESRYYGIVSAPLAVITSILFRPFPNNILLSFSDWLELRVNKFKFMRPYNQYVLLILIKR